MTLVPVDDTEGVMLLLVEDVKGVLLRLADVVEDVIPVVLDEEIVWLETVVELAGLEVDDEMAPISYY